VQFAFLESQCQLCHAVSRESRSAREDWVEKIDPRGTRAVRSVTDVADAVAVFSDQLGPRKGR
jgi:hypothetical protein